MYTMYMLFSHSTSPEEITRIFIQLRIWLSLSIYTDNGIYVSIYVTYVRMLYLYLGVEMIPHM